MAKTSKPKKGRKVVYCKYIVRNGKRMYPRNAKCFRLEL